jgi:hypothetical protein
LTAKKTTDLTFNRTEVLEFLWKRRQWLSEKIDNNQTQYNKKLEAKRKLISSECHVCQIILQGLTDQELELRVMELETKLANSILIPKNTEEKKK